MCPWWDLGYAKSGGKDGLKWYGVRGQQTISITGVFSCKTISGKCTMAWVIVEAVCVLQKTEPDHSPIFLFHNFLQWFSTVNWHRRKLFYLVLEGEEQ